jgi:uncharacterized protein YutE (UPF0331/DUF86 family)
LPDCELIRYQAKLIKHELSDVDSLLSRVLQSEPDSIEMRAMAAVFQSVYNGVEIILIALLNSRGAETSSWHRRILRDSRDQEVITESEFDMLDQLMRFRHKFRHSYGFTLNWQMMKPLVPFLPLVEKIIDRIIQSHCP